MYSSSYRLFRRGRYSPPWLQPLLQKYIAYQIRSEHCTFAIVRVSLIPARTLYTCMRHLVLATVYAHASALYTLRTLIAVCMHARRQSTGILETSKCLSLQHGCHEKAERRAYNGRHTGKFQQATQHYCSIVQSVSSLYILQQYALLDYTMKDYSPYLWLSVGATKSRTASTYINILPLWRDACHARGAILLKNVARLCCPAPRV